MKKDEKEISFSYKEKKEIFFFFFFSKKEAKEIAFFSKEENSPKDPGYQCTGRRRGIRCGKQSQENR